MYFRRFRIIFGAYDYVIMKMSFVFIVMIIYQLIVTSIISFGSHHDNFCCNFFKANCLECFYDLSARVTYKEGHYYKKASNVRFFVLICH